MWCDNIQKVDLEWTICKCYDVIRKEVTWFSFSPDWVRRKSTVAPSDVDYSTWQGTSFAEWFLYPGSLRMINHGNLIVSLPTDFRLSLDLFLQTTHKAFNLVLMVEVRFEETQNQRIVWGRELLVNKTACDVPLTQSQWDTQLTLLSYHDVNKNSVKTSQLRAIISNW